MVLRMMWYKFNTNNKHKKAADTIIVSVPAASQKNMITYKI